MDTIQISGLTAPTVEGFNQWQAAYPDAYTALLRLQTNSGTTKGKGYSLTKIPCKKTGFVYYVRYVVDGREIPTKWTTYTNDRVMAETYARLNRDRFLAAYYAKRQTRSSNLYKIFSEYYEKGSSYLAAAHNRGRVLSEKTRLGHLGFINNKFIPALKKLNVRYFSDVKPHIIAKIQDGLLSEGLKPQTINRAFCGINTIYIHLVRDGVIADNPLDVAKSLKTSDKDWAQRGCYELNKLKGKFNHVWENEQSYILSLLIYTTGLRNSEIERITLRDIIKIDDCYFIDVKQSKSENGIRLVPLHRFVHEKITRYIEHNKKNETDFIFINWRYHNQATIYRLANVDLGALAGMSKKELDAHGITFYSGRHFWKTMMSAAGLGEDIEEYFMGHKVSGDVSKRYNHLDKRGEAALLAKTREVYAALDEYLLLE